MAEMGQGISEIFGEALDEAGVATPLYRALRPLLCSSCGSPIPSGALFTRQTVHGLSLRIMPRCRECAPFEPRGEVEGRKSKRSKLMDNLLAPAADERPKEPESQSEKAREESARRLGPALSRSRRKPR